MAEESEIPSTGANNLNNTRLKYFKDFCKCVQGLRQQMTRTVTNSSS